jgi:hypothetical protein
VRRRVEDSSGDSIGTANAGTDDTVTSGIPSWNPSVACNDS